MGIATFNRHRASRRITANRVAPDRLADLKAKHARLREELAEVGRQIADLTAAEKKAAGENDVPPPASTAAKDPKRAQR